MNEAIHNAVAESIDHVVALRHRLHETAEGAFEEHETSAIISRELTLLGIPHRRRVGGTGIVASVRGARPGQVVALRAEMDALAMGESTGKPYASRREGFAHACGHDGHVAMVLAAARVLKALRDRLGGEVRLLFQPAEETALGAQAMIADGALGEPRPSAIFALHAWPSLPAGVLACRPGGMTSATDMLAIRLTGRGGHGARPEQACSPIVPAARIIQELSALARPAQPGRSVRVVSVGSVHAGTRPNVIPDTAVLEGTVRSGDETVRRELHERIHACIREACEGTGVRADVTWQAYCPAVQNDPDLHALFRRVADDLLGPDRRVVMAGQSAGAEDFSRFLAHVPGLLVRIGVGENAAPLHNSAFDFADDALASGTALLVGLSLAAAGRPGGASAGGRGSEGDE